MRLLVPDSMRAEIAPLVPEGDDGILISYLWPKRVPAEELARYRLALNFHPAPLPEYRGFAPYTWGILNGEKWWGCAAHHMVEEIDAGPIVAERRWPMRAGHTAASLREETHVQLRYMLLEVLRNFDLTKTPRGQERYYSKLDFENARHSRAWDPEVARRAFHCPPHAGWEPL